MSNSSKRKGSSFEKAVADYLAEALQDDRVERRALQGINDRGDVAGVRFNGKRVVLECKACTRLEVPKWLREAETERQNDGAAFGVVVSKRRGVGDVNTGQQLVLMTLDTFAAMLKEGDHE